MSSSQFILPDNERRRKGDVICCFMKLNGNSKTTRYLSQIGQGKLNATTIEAEDVPVPAKPVQIEHKIGFTA